MGKETEEANNPVAVYYRFPIGLLRLTAEDGCLIGLDMARGDEGQDPEAQNLLNCRAIEMQPVLGETITQLQEYFAGKRREFTIPIRTSGTSFREKVWEALRTIPYGETRSYGQIAAQIGEPKACRAVGGANHNNPIMIITPCHRVIGGNGSLTGFGGGLEVKEALLRLEREHCG